jgi:hypothetical protein
MQKVHLEIAYGYVLHIHMNILKKGVVLFFPIFPNVFNFCKRFRQNDQKERVIMGKSLICLERSILTFVKKSDTEGV